VTALTGRASDFQSPPAATAGGLNVIRGPFGGDAANTTVSVSGKAAQVVVETPRAAYYKLPSGLTPGPNEVVVAEGNRLVRFQLQVIRLSMSADRLQLNRNESTSFRATVTGCQGMPASGWQSGSVPEFLDPATLPALAPGFHPPGPNDPGVILLTIQNGSPGSITLKRASGEVVVLPITPALLKDGSYVFNDEIHALRAGGFTVTAVLQAFLAPVPGQEAQNVQNEPNIKPPANPDRKSGGDPNNPNLPGAERKSGGDPVRPDGAGGANSPAELTRLRNALDAKEEEARQARRAAMDAQARADALKASGQNAMNAQQQADQLKQQANALNQQATALNQQANSVAGNLPVSTVTQVYKKQSLDYKSLIQEINQLIQQKRAEAEAKRRNARTERDLAANASSPERVKQHQDAAAQSENEATTLEGEVADLQDRAGDVQKKSDALDKQIEQLEKSPPGKPSASGSSPPQRAAPAGPYVYTPARLVRDTEIGAQFAPIFYEGMGDHMRSDYITNFDFDGDWRGDNNWDAVEDLKIKIYAHVYFSVIETSTHYYVHYAVYHPRDYKGGLHKSVLLESALHQVKEEMGGDPTGVTDSIALSHENDLEGCLVVAEKRGEDPAAGSVQYIETMAHNRYLKYHPSWVKTNIGEEIQMRGQHALMFVEPKGHGTSKYTGEPKQLKDCIKGVLIYSYTGHADDQEETGSRNVGYDLVPVYTTLWAHAHEGGGVNETFGEAYQFGVMKVFCELLTGQKDEVDLAMGALGVAFRGLVAFPNKARPPWGWYDMEEKNRPRGEWFFDPAGVVKRHYKLPEAIFSTAYTFNPYMNIAE
jgi:hypothetical protein